MDINMESSKLPILLEEVLSGRPEDPQLYTESIQKLHKLLKSGTPSTIVGVKEITSELTTKGKLSYSDYDLFSNYMSNIKKAIKPPELSHLTVVNSGLKVSSIFHSLHKIHLKSQALKHIAFSSILIADQRNRNKLDLKRLECTRMIANLKSNLGINMQKTISAWSSNIKVTKPVPIKRKESLTLEKKRNKKYRAVRLILMTSPLAFEQQAFWKWKIVYKEQKQAEERFKEAVQFNNKLKEYLLKKNFFEKLKNNTLPLWVLKQTLLSKVLRKSELRFFYVKKIKFESMRGIQDYDEIEEIQEEEEEEHRKKIVRTLKKRSGALNEQTKKSEKKNFIKENENLLSKVFKKAAIRNFYGLRLNIIKWKIPEDHIKKNTKMDINKSKKLRASKPSGKFEIKKPNEIESLVINITSKSLHNVEKEIKIPMLLESQLRSNKLEPKLEKIVNIMKDISNQRKEFPSNFIKKWEFLSLYKEINKDKYLKGLFCLKNVLKTFYQKIISAYLKTVNDSPMYLQEETTERTYKSVHKEVIEEFTEFQVQRISPEKLKPLVKKVLEYEKINHICLLKWKNKYNTKKLAISLQPDSEQYKKALLSSILKINKSRILECFKIWLMKKQSKSFENKKNKVEKFMEILNKSISKTAKVSLEMPENFKSSDEILSNAVIALCKNLLWAKTKVFNTWARSIASKGIQSKVEEYLLRNLAKYPKMMLLHFYLKWKEYKTNNSRQLFSMISVLHRIFSTKGKRCFNPPRIIKDADQIMRRTIRKLTSVKDWALREGMIKWKYFKLISKSGKNNRSIVKLLFILANPIKFPFKTWAEKIKINKLVDKSHGVSSIVAALNRAFRSRYKTLIYKSLISKKRIDLLGYVWRIQSKKYYDNIKMGISTWKNQTDKEILLNHQAKTNSKVVRLVQILDKKLTRIFKIVEGFNKSTYNKHLTEKFRSLKIMVLFNKILKNRLQTILNSINPTGKVFNIVKKLVLSYKNKKKHSFGIWERFSKNCKTKKLLDGYKKSRLKELLKQHCLDNLYTAHQKIYGHGNRVKGAIKGLVVAFNKKTKLAFTKWNKYMQLVNSKHLLDNAKSSKLNLKLNKIGKRTIRDAYLKISNIIYISHDTFIKSPLNTVQKILQKGIMEALSKWKEYALYCSNRSLLGCIKKQSLKNCIEKVSRRSLSTVFDCITDRRNAKSKLKLVFLRAENTLMNSFKTWKDSGKSNIHVVSKQEKLKVLGISLSYKVSKLVNSRTRSAFKSMVKSNKLFNLFNRYRKNYYDLIRHAYLKLWHRVEKFKIIDKMNLCYYVVRTHLNYAAKVKESKFKYWRDLEYLRKRRTMRRFIGRMMDTCCIYYETAFWRWKYIIINKRIQVTPRHSLTFKRLALIVSDYKRRLGQYSFYKLIIFNKNLSIPKNNFNIAIAHLSKYSKDISTVDDYNERQLCNFLDISKSLDHISNISTVIPGKLPREEVNFINQAGATEIIGILLKSVRMRTLAWSISSIITYGKQVAFYDNERTRIIAQINELRYEKHSLLEDNNTLRQHNENLIENLEKTNLEFQALSLNLDNMRLVRMVRVMSNMVEVPMAEAFFTIYDKTFQE